MKTKSIWTNNVKKEESKKIDKDYVCDILIIGGGITGLSTAYHLRNSSLKVMLVERNKIASGVTARTTGKLTYLQQNVLGKLKNKAHIYFEAQKDAINMVESIIKENNIDCDFEKVDSYIYAQNDKQISDVLKEKDILDSINVKYEEKNRLPFDIKCIYALCAHDTAVFHPVKYLLALKKIIENNNINIYENSRVEDVVKEKKFYVCKVNNYTIKTKTIVVACHYAFFLKPYFLPFKTYLEKSYVSASKSDNKYFSAISINKPIRSIRYYKNNLIYLFDSHSLCVKNNNKKNFNNLLKEANNLKIKPDYIWSNYDVMTEDHLPYIGYIDNNLLLGTGYNTWGMTNASLAGKIISDLILKKDNKYAKLFDPKRNKGFSVLKYPLYLSFSCKSYIGNKLFKNKAWYSDNVLFTKINGKSVIIYTDEYSKKHIVYNKCPHMKCSLIFNEVEKTFDCPCHGSRYDIDGKCLYGPSKKDIGYKK